MRVYSCSEDVSFSTPAGSLPHEYASSFLPPPGVSSLDEKENNKSRRVGRAPSLAHGRRALLEEGSAGLGLGSPD